MLVDGSESDEGAGAQSREPEGEEEEPAAAIDPDSGLGPMTAEGGRPGTRHTGAKHVGISRRTRRPIEACGDEVVKGFSRRGRYAASGSSRLIRRWNRASRCGA